MYCYRCGEKLVDSAHFCHMCGADQSEVEKLYKNKTRKIDSETPSFTPPKKEDTQTFHLGGNSEEEDLNTYLSEVDSKVKKTVESYEETESQKNGSFFSIKKKEKSNLEETPSKIEPKSKKEKRGFKQIWKDFIDEEDNEYSVFGELVDTKENKTASTPSKEETIQLSNTVSAHDEMISGNLETETGDYTGMVKKVNEILEKEEKEKTNSSSSESLSKTKSEEEVVPSKPEEVPAKKISETPKENLEKKDSSKIETIDSHSIPQQSNTKIPKDSKETQGEKAPFFSSFFQKSKEKAKEKKDAVVTKKEKSKFKKDSVAAKKEDEKVEKQSISTEIPTSSTKASTKETSSKGKEISGFFHKLNHSSFMEKIESLYFKCLHWVIEKEKMGLIALFIIGAIFAVIPIFFIEQRVTALNIFYSILKIVLGIFTFLFSNSIVRNTTDSRNLKQTIVSNSLLQWAIAQVLLLILFFPFPSHFVMGRNLLGAVTPHIIASVILYLVAIIMSFVSVRKRLSHFESIEYIGWFSISFIVIDLIVKLLWVIIIFITNTIL